MNADQMIDYVLGQLDGPDRERMEQTMNGDPRIASRVDGLGRTLPLLLDDGFAPKPPPALARRTLTLVAQSRSRPRSRSILDYIPVRVPFRWADLAVAASIFIAGILTLVPAIQRSRERMNEAGCLFNLQQLGHSFAQYASINPVVPLSALARGRRARGDVRGVPPRRRRASGPFHPRLSLQRPVFPPRGRPAQLLRARADSPDRPPALPPPALLGLRL